MSAFGVLTERKILDHAMGGTTWTAPAELYVALFTSALTANDLEQDPPVLTNELDTAVGAYARVASFADFATAADTDVSYVTTISNDGQIDFTQATANWQDSSANTLIRYVALMTTASGTGEVVFWGQLVSDKTITTNDTFSFAIGDLTITLD